MEVSKVILCIDLKSFYASIECVDRGLNPFFTPLVVADKERGPGTIILAVSPYLKEEGIPSRLRVYELPKRDDIIFAKPRMERYLEISARIVSLYLKYVNEDDLHVYSIDECFLDVTNYLTYHKLSPIDLAKKIKNDIYKKFHLTCTIGIGDNLLLSKIAMDIEAKKTSSGIARWTIEDVPSKLWPIKPLSKFWGIGKNYEKKLNAIGLYSMGDIARYPKKLLIDAFGVIGGQIHDHSNGIDNSSIRDKYIPEKESLSSGQVLFKDYSIEEITLIIREMLDDLVLRLIYQNKMTSCVRLSIMYSQGGGFSSQIDIGEATDNIDKLYEALIVILRKKGENKPIRRVSITLSNLKIYRYYQLDLFTSLEKEVKSRKLMSTLAKIKEKYGNNAVLRASSKQSHSTIKERHNQIGGHHK